MSRTAALLAVDQIFAAIARHLKNAGRIEIRGLGTLEGKRKRYGWQSAARLKAAWKPSQNIRWPERRIKGWTRISRERGEARHPTLDKRRPRVHTARVEEPGPTPEVA